MHTQKAGILIATGQVAQDAPRTGRLMWVWGVTHTHWVNRTKEL